MEKVGCNKLGKDVPLEEAVENYTDDCNLDCSMKDTCRPLHEASNKKVEETSEGGCHE